MSGLDELRAVPRFRRPTRDDLASYWSDVVTAWRVPAVKRGLLATTLLFVGSLTPAYLPQNSPWWEPIRALGWDTWPAKVIGTALVVAAVVLLVDAWFRLRPGLYQDFKHWAVLLIWSLPLLFAPPIFSHDAYSYAAQGWLLHNGLNPYDTPVSVLPGAFADQVSWVWRYTPAPYGPLALQISHLMVVVGGLNPYYSTLLMRIPALIGVALIVYFLPRLAARLGADVQLTAWFSTINPLLVIDLVGGMHNDSLMIGLIIVALYLTHRRPQWFWLGAVIVGVAAAIKQPALLAAYPVALIGLPWQWNTSHVLNKLARAAVSSAIAVATFVAISLATGLNFGWLNALDVPGRVVTLAPLSLIGEGLRLLCVAAGRPELGTQIAGGLLVAGVVASALIVAYLAVTVARHRPVTFLSWSYLWIALLGPAMHSWYLLWGGLLLPLTRPTERMQRVAVGVTSVLLGYGAGNLAWRNDTGIALGLAGLALIITLLVRYFDEHRKSQGGDMSDVIFDVQAGVGRITLNRPQAINALTTAMLADIGEQLSVWADEPSVERVHLRGAGERGLCSGADVRALRADLLERGEVVAEVFFSVEYAVDALIATYPKPIRADLFGITMGGGLGLSAHCADRVVRADSRLAMPETIIGLFPDVGVLYELSRVPGELGTHLALTGGTVGAHDAVLVGLADRVEGEAPAGDLAWQRDWIDECYAGDDPLAIVQRLAEHPDPQARATAEVLRQRCPFSVAVSLAAIRRAATLPDVASVLAQDLVLAVPMVLRPDFAEGVRAQLVDKDRNPGWRPSRLEDVDAREVAALFADLG